MSAQQDAARDLETAAAEIEAFIRSCPERTWQQLIDNEGRTVGEIAYHCALGNDVGLGWICQLLAARPVSETRASLDAFNASEAARGAGVTKADVVDILSRTTARTAAFLRSLTDEELERRAVFGLIGQERSVGAVIPVFARHMRGHLESMRAAVDT